MAQSSDEQTWLDRALDTQLPEEIRRLRETTEPNAIWLKDVVTNTVLQLIGDFGAHARDRYRRFEEWLVGLSDHVQAHEEGLDDHEERLAEVEAFVEALGAVTQLLPSDADDIAKLAAGAKWIASELLTKGEQEPEGAERLADLIALAERVGKLAEAARVDVEPEDEEPDVFEPEAEPQVTEPN